MKSNRNPSSANPTYHHIPANIVHRLLESLAAALDTIYHRPQELSIEDAVHNLHQVIFDEVAVAGLSENEKALFDQLKQHFLYQWAKREKLRSLNSPKIRNKIQNYL